jgi:formylglycine-generating enzyme required for sulfatase activity
MGQVWVAQDQSLRRQVALKLVLPGRVDLRSVELFAREARAGGRLAHPNIVTTLAHGSDGGLAWIAQELIEGSWTLKDFLDELRAADAVPKDYYPKVADLVAQLADALAAAHEAGVIHRDVKPQNVLIAPDDRPKLTDFGLARVVDDSVLSRTGDFAGTYAYMSPEQVTAKRMGLDHRTDVFSLGIVLYELLTLRRPFEGDTTHQIAAKIITFDPPDASKIRSQCPRDLAVICAKALEKDPDRRFPTMREFAADLRRHLANEPILARPSGAWTHAVKWVKRHPVVSSSGAVAALAFAIVAVLLVDNVRTNTKLGQANADLGQANTDLSEQTRIAKDNATLAEQRAGETAEQARIAREAERDAEQKLADVLSLSANRNLERLAARAKDLNPPTPEMVPRYEEWLREAQELLEGRSADPVTGAPARPSLAEHRARLDEIQARALSETDPARLEAARAHPRFAELEALRAHILWHRRMLGDEPWPDQAEVEALLASEELRVGWWSLNWRAWKIVDPSAHKFGDEVRALLLAMAAEKERAAEVERVLCLLAWDIVAPAAHKLGKEVRAVLVRSMADADAAAEVKKTLAWAQFRTGRLDEAHASCALAASAADDGSFDKSLTALRAKLAEWEPALQPARRDDLTRLANRETDLALAVGERRFAKEDDSWWNEQLIGLVSGIEALHDRETGLAGDTLNAAFGWGIAKRYEFACTIQRESIERDEAQRLWSEAIAAIKASAKYNGLELTPQLGLLPIGMDPHSQLWEFAHLQSGDVAQRREDGTLELTETTGIVLVLIPGGTFTMGAQSTDPSGANYDPNAQSDEGPPHAVTLSPYFISKYEMTQGQWLATYAANPSVYNEENYSDLFNRDGLAWNALHPVENISWFDCNAATRDLGLVLPSEAQWEHSARGGKSSVYWTGNNLESLQDAENVLDSYQKAQVNPLIGWMYEAALNDGNEVHAQVGSYGANGYGLHDVLGNVGEWCSDGYLGDAYSAPEGAVDPQFAGDGLHHIIRGGSFDGPALGARSALRSANSPELRYSSLGFRPARGIAP